MSLESPWTLWSVTRPTDLKLSYRWRIPTCDILGLSLRPEWTDQLHSRSGLGDIEYWPGCAHWTGWRHEIPPGLEWRVAGPDEKAIFWGGLDLLPCPFTGRQPVVSYFGRWITAPAYHAEKLHLQCYLIDGFWSDAAKMREMWNTRVIPS